MIAILSAQERKEELAVIFFNTGFFHLVHLFQMCCSDVNAESVCPYYSLQGNLLRGMIDFRHFISTVNNPPTLAVE